MVFDEINKPFELKPCKLNPKEKAKIEHEVNTNYTKYNGQEYCVHYSFGLDNRAYRFYFENHGFNRYNIYARKIIKSKKR